MVSRRTTGIILTVFGVIALILADGFYSFSETYTSMYGFSPITYSYPWRPYAFPVALVGIILLVIGIIFIVQRDEKTKQ